MYTVHLMAGGTVNKSINFATLREALAFASERQWVMTCVDDANKQVIASFKRGICDTWHNDYRAIIREYDPTL